MVDLIVTLVVGGIVGWLASLIMKTSAQMGVLANVVVGIVGSVLGSWLFGAIGLVAYGSVGRWVMSVAGAVVLIWILKVLKIMK
jgi:uncharacterized membrane protein YeaQ/YmgE (transglycosylase-associated protein family)